MTDLTEEVKSLKAKLDSGQQEFEQNQTELQTAIDTLTAQVNASVELNLAQEMFKTEINARQDVFEQNQTRLQSQVNALTKQFNATSEENINRIEGDLVSLRTLVNTSHVQFEQEQAMLQSSVGTLTNRFNSPMNLYQNCYQDVRTCNADPRNGRYWEQCSTETLPIDQDVSLNWS